MNVQPLVAHICLSEGISIEELKEMVNRSAPLTHDWANRRWKNWVFRVDMPTMTVHRMAYFEISGARAVGDYVYSECGRCDGKGCRYCGWNGVYRKSLDKLQKPRHNHG